MTGGLWESWGKTTRAKWLPEFDGPAAIVGSVEDGPPRVIGPFADCRAALDYAENTDLDDWLIMPIQPAEEVSQ